jgi:hypothetical protein
MWLRGALLVTLAASIGGASAHLAGRLPGWQGEMARHTATSEESAVPATRRFPELDLDPMEATETAASTATATTGGRRVHPVAPEGCDRGVLSHPQPLNAGNQTGMDVHSQWIWRYNLSHPDSTYTHMAVRRATRPMDGLGVSTGAWRVHWWGARPQTAGIHSPHTLCLRSLAQNPRGSGLLAL